MLAENFESPTKEIFSLTRVCVLFESTVLLWQTSLWMLFAIVGWSVCMKNESVPVTFVCNCSFPLLAQCNHYDVAVGVYQRVNSTCKTIVSALRQYGTRLQTDATKLSIQIHQ